MICTSGSSKLQEADREGREPGGHKAKNLFNESIELIIGRERRQGLEPHLLPDSPPLPAPKSTTDTRMSLLM